MTTPKTDAIMALADRYAFHIPGSQHSDEARAALLAALQEQAQPTLKWCDQCGEGVTDFCRGKGGKCAYGFKPAGQPVQPVAKPLSEVQKLDIVTQWFTDESDITRAMQMLTDFEQTTPAHGIGGAL